MPTGTAPPATVPRRYSPTPLSRTCGSWLQRPCVPVAFAMPIADPEHQDPQAERHRAVVDFRPNAGLIAAIGGDQGFVQHGQAAYVRELFDGGIDTAQRLLLTAVV